MFRFELRLLVAAVAILSVVAVNAQAQVPKPEQAGPTSDQQARMRGLENELVELRRLVGKYQKQLAVVLVEDERAREVARLQAWEVEAQKELTRVAELYQVTREELEGTVNDRIELQAQVARLAKRVEDEPGERVQLQKEREELTTQLVVLTEELKRERVRQDAEIERARQAAVSLGEKLRQTMAENERLEGRYLQTTESLATLQDGFRLISSDAQSARQQLRLARERENRLEQQLAAIRDDRTVAVENNELVAALAEARNAHREQTDEIIRLRADLRGVSRERNQLASEIKAAEAAKIALSEKGAETERLIEEMRGQIEETGAIREELNKVQQQKQQLQVALRTLRDQSDERAKLVVALEKSDAAKIQQEQRIGRLRAELEDAATARQQLESALKAAGETQNKIRSRQERVNTALADARTRLNQTLTEAVKARQQLVAAQKESEISKQQVAKLEAQNEKSRAELAKTMERLNARDTQEQKDLARLALDLQKAKEEAVKTRQQLVAAQQESEISKQQVAKLEAQNEKSRAELAKTMERLNARNTQEQKDLARLQLTLQKANQEKDSLSGILKKRTAELEEAQKTLTSVQTELREASTRSGQQTQEIRRFKVALATATEEKENLAGTLKKWDAQRQEATKTQAGLQRKLEAANSQLEHNAQKIGSLEGALKRASENEKARTMEVERIMAEQGEAAVAAKTELEAVIQSAREERESWRQEQMASAAKLSDVSAQLDKLKEEKKTADEKLQALSSEKQSLAKAISNSYERAVKELGPEIEEKAVTVIEGPDRMTIRVGGAALFSPGEASLRAQSRAMLDKVAALLKEFPDYDVRAEGHTDSTGNWASNWRLSALRAGAVVRYLQEKGIKPERLASTGYAFYRPVASNDTPEGRAANRRIEISLEPKE